jgi:predicted permease
MFTSDLKHAARLLIRNPVATGIMMFTLALGIGAATAIFSVVYGVLLSPLPYPDSGRIMAVWEVNNRGTWSQLADPNFDDFRDQNRSFQALAKYASQVLSVAGGNEPTRTRFSAVSKDFFTVLGVHPRLGRVMSAEDARVGAAPVVVASDRYWKRSLGSAEDLSRFRLRIAGRDYAVIGVMAPGFEFPAADLWAPAELDPENTSRTGHNFKAIGRLRDGVTAAQANEDVSRIARGIVRSSAEQNDYLLKDAAAVPLLASLTGRVGTPLYVLLGAVIFLLLVACANVANLLLSQAAARARELAIRSALGAGRGRLMRQMLTEALLLGLLGCAGGVLLALWGVSVLRGLAPAGLPRLENVAISLPALGFAASVSVLVAAGLGVVTAWRATSPRMRAPLVEGGRGAAGSRSSQRLGRVLVAAQFATTLVLLVGAGLLGRSLLSVLSVDPGFRTERIMTMDLSLPYSEDPAAKARLAGFYGSALERLGAIAGVQEVGINSVAPMDGGCPDGMFAVVSPQEMPGSVPELIKLFGQKERQGEADFCVASPGYFQALGIPLVRGRLFDAHDGFEQPHVALITESLARSRWPGEDPIGRTIEFGNMDGDLRLLTIVGIVGDTHEYGLERPPQPTVYADAAQRPRFETTVVMRTAADPDAAVAAARAIVRDLAPDVPPRFRTVAEIESATLGARHFNLTLIAVFAIAALLLAVAGIYGVTAYSVAQRTREIGVRIALGARSSNVLGMILGQGLRVTLVGVGVGVAGALALTRAIQSLLFGVTATDPLTFAGITLLLAGVAALACYVPARRATRVDPMVALREE